MTESNRSLAAAAERKAAQIALAEATALHQMGFCGGAVSRAYYAAYHAARALLYEKGLEPKTHEGVRRMLGLHCVVTGELTAGTADALAKLAFMREAADYAPVQPPAAAEAADAVKMAGDFLSAARC